MSENILRGNYYFKFLVLDSGIRKPEALLDMSINYIAMGHRLNRENKQILLWMCARGEDSEGQISKLYDNLYRNTMRHIRHP